MAFSIFLCEVTILRYLTTNLLGRQKADIFEIELEVERFRIEVGHCSKKYKGPLGGYLLLVSTPSPLPLTYNKSTRENCIH